MAGGRVAAGGPTVSGFLLDTDWIIDGLTGQAAALRELRRLPPSLVAVSVVSVGELFESAFNSPNPGPRLANVRSLLSGTRILPVTEPIMTRFAEIRAHLRRHGQLISDFDIVIGAIALEYDLTVLTRNKRHFSRIPDLRLYGAM